MSWVLTIGMKAQNIFFSDGHDSEIKGRPIARISFLLKKGCFEEIKKKSV